MYKWRKKKKKKVFFSIPPLSILSYSVIPNIPPILTVDTKPNQSKQSVSNNYFILKK